MPTLNGGVLNEKRSEIKEDNPGCGIGEVAKIAGKMWKELEDSEKKVYEKAYEKERKVYLAKMEDYVPPSGWGSRINASIKSSIMLRYCQNSLSLTYSFHPAPKLQNPKHQKTQTLPKNH